MDALKRNCKICKNKVRRDDLYRINMNMKDGKVSILLCSDCASKIMVSDQDVKSKLGERQ